MGRETDKSLRVNNLQKLTTQVYTFQLKDHLNYVKLELDNLACSVNLLIDTGAQINIIKKQNVKQFEVNTNTRLYIKGITADLCNTLGTVNLPINKIMFEFHVVPDSLPIPYEGILGIKCLQSHKLRLDKGYFKVAGKKFFLQTYRRKY